MQCEICQSQSFKYSCPRCNIKYCSLDCYRSENHGQCSEAFYKECVLDELQHQKANKDDTRKILEMLQRIEDEPEQDFESLDSDDDESDVGDLEERLAEVNLNNADAVWDKLTDEEKQEFKSIVFNGEIDKIVQPVKPWWNNHLDEKLVRDIQEDERKITEILKECPKVFANVKEFQKISTKKPAACIIYNIANVIAAYTYIFRYYNGDHNSYDLEASNNLITICENLKSNANFDSISLAVDSVMMECHNANLFSDLSTKDAMHEDLKEIFNGPGSKSHEKSYILSVLSDIINLFKSAKQSYRQNNPKEKTSAEGGTKKTFSSEFFANDALGNFKQLENQTHFTGCLKKIEFYLSFTKFCYNIKEWPVIWEML
ncbi:CLUMA_CG002561, isoform A [Clunio marinus]|uniref:CLUMA_CG002561, isoform A n=1 Tax=Clunio marinus TaxID=568069 RepID=A0A1J1HLD9_9DIPT|nr:CLUMA_CG002561, isoform A [Clunio marinus]